MSDDLPERVAKDLDHVLRTPLPWRDQPLTECGLPAGKCRVITHDDVIAKIRRVGQTRAAFSTCITCTNKVSYSLRSGHVIEPSLVSVLRRECSNYSRDDLLEVELRAIAELVNRHRSEFEGLMGLIADVPDIVAWRTRRGRR